MSEDEILKKKQYIQEEILKHDFGYDRDEDVDDSLRFIHNVLSNIYDDDKLNVIFHNDLGIKKCFFFMLEKEDFIKFTSNLFIFKDTSKGRYLLDNLNEIYGEMRSEEYYKEEIEVMQRKINELQYNLDVLCQAEIKDE